MQVEPPARRLFDSRCSIPVDMMSLRPIARVLLTSVALLATVGDGVELALAQTAASGTPASTTPASTTPPAPAPAESKPIVLLGDTQLQRPASSGANRRSNIRSGVQTGRPNPNARANPNRRTTTSSARRPATIRTPGSGGMSSITITRTGGPGDPKEDPAFDPNALELDAVDPSEAARAPKESVDAAADPTATELTPFDLPAPSTESGTLAVAGDGFDGATHQPPPVGDPSAAGFTAKAIARWDFVPYQTFDKPFNVGVVAFHAFGIDRVEFSVAGGPWTAIKTPSLNPESKIVEFWARVDPTTMLPGQKDIRAIAYPTVGLPRVLAGALDATAAEKGECGMYFEADPQRELRRLERWVSPNGSDVNTDGSAKQPFLTIMKAAKSIALANGGKADGGIINLLEGDHLYGGYMPQLLTDVERRWITIRPAPGVAPEKARIVGVSNSGTRLRLVKFENVTVQPAPGANGAPGSNTVFVSSLKGDYRLWLDGCTLTGVGHLAPGEWTNGWKYQYVTNTYATESQNGFVGAELQRNVSLGVIGGAAFANSRLVINSEVGRIDTGSTNAKAEFYKLDRSGGKTFENTILYGCLMHAPSTAAGLSAQASSLCDVAIVSVRFDNRIEGAKGSAFDFAGPINHLVVEDCDILGPASWRANEPGFSLRDVLIRDSRWAGEGVEPRNAAGVTYDRD